MRKNVNVPKRIVLEFTPSSFRPRHLSSLKSRGQTPEPGYGWHGKKFRELSTVDAFSVLELCKNKNPMFEAELCIFRLASVTRCIDKNFLVVVVASYGQ